MPPRPLKVAVLMEPLSRTEPEETNGLLIMQEATARGHAVWQFGPEGLMMDERSAVKTRARRVEVDVAKRPHYTLGADELITLDDMDVIFIRHQPPYDMAYLSPLYLLEHVSKKVLMVNDPKAVRDYAEKLIPLEFPQFMPPTLITADQKAMEAFYAEHKNIVIKPLFMFDGQGVVQVAENCQNLLPVLRMETMLLKAPVIAQKFIPQVSTTGNVRLFMFGGELSGALATLPVEGNIDTHIWYGNDRAHEPTEREREIAKTLGSWLMERGIFFAGIDVIGGYITEVNITCPGMLIEYAAATGKHLESILWDKIEASC